MDPNYPGQAPPDPIIGLTIGNYVVRQKLGEGGMGSVYLAEHPHIGKKVALKVLHAEFASNTDVVTRFFNEAKAVNDIGHPNIVDIVDYGVLAFGGPGEQLVYFVMEFLPGSTLSGLLQREAPLPPERALGIALQVADALAASHKANIVHRDLKPDNIILIQRGRERDFVKLLDFGIAKLTGDQPGSRRTRTGLVMGTPAYMSPEQCEGRGNVDARADIYALGIVLYEMITGRVPFFGDGYGEVLVQHLTQPPPPPSTIRGVIPPHVEQVILKALEKRPELRYPTMDEMSRAMADPVGYVESHGGIGQFLQMPLQATNEPIPPVSRLTPTPLTALTPVPGQLGAPTPTTLTSGVGQVDQSGGKKKPIGLFVGIGLAVAAAAAVAIVVMSGGGGTSTAAEPVDPGTGSQVGSATGSDQGSAGSAAGSATGSDQGSAGSAAGSATGSDQGSAAGSATGSDQGSAAGSATGSGAEVGSGSAAGSSDPAVAKTITITVASTPSGAFVTFGEETTPRGKTPVTFEIPRSDGESTIEISLPGYHDEERTISLSGKVDLEVALKKKSRGKSGRGSGSSTDSGGGTGVGDDVLDPFANDKKK